MNTSTKAKAALTNQSRVAESRWNVRWSRQFTAYLFLLPAILLFALFAWYPILRAVVMSFQDVNLTGGSTWVGLDNYALMLKDPAFEIAWRNSIQFALWSIGLGYLLPVGMAILIREMRFAQGFFRIVYFLPTVVPGAIAVIMWRFIYDPDAGMSCYTFLAEPANYGCKTLFSLNPHWSRS